jgi:hypothetical protein
VNLERTQSLFMRYILSADAEAGDAEEFHGIIAEQGGIAVDKRMEIYATAYRARLKETIETDHEILGLYLGDELFDKMVKDYVATHPSSFYSLRQFCDALPDFLQADVFFAQYPLISDLARFERQLLHAFDAAESSRASFEDLQAIAPQAWPEIRFRFHPSVQIFRCESNAVETWQSLKAEQSPPAPNHSQFRSWMLWRGKSRISEFISLAPPQLALLEGFIRGQTFAQQCEAMLQWHDVNTAPAEVLGTIQSWFERGIVRSIERP